MLASFMSTLASCFRSLRTLVPAALVLLGFAATPRAFAQTATAADIAPASLPGKTITLNSFVAQAPFQGTGIFTITFTGTNYTMPIAAGNATLYSGSYTAVTQAGTTIIRLNGYLVGGSPVQLILVPQAAALIPGAFEMFADGVTASKTGTFTVSGTSTGGGGTGNPAITSQTQVVATVGQPFTYQITTSPAATSYTNTGGNAPIAISPGSGLVTGTFTAAGTFTFSFTATNASGTSAVTTVTVTATGGSTGGGSGGSVASYAGTYRGSILQRTSGVTSILGGASYSTVITTAGAVTTTLTNAGSTSTLTGTIDSTGTIAFTGGTGANIYRITSGSVSASGATFVFGTAFFVASTSSTGATSEFSLQTSTSFVADPTGGGGTGGSTGTPATAVRAFGWNLSGQTTLPANLTNVVQVIGTSQGSFALKADGTVTAWGTGLNTEAPTAAVTGVTALATASNSIVGLKSDGSLVQWGPSSDGTRTNFPTSGTFTAISGRYFHFLAVRSDGTVVSWGADPAFPPLAQPPAGLTGVKSVAAGTGFDLALKTDGTVVGWNTTSSVYVSTNTDKGQSRPPAGLSNVVAIAAGQFHGLALKADGTVVGWGGTRNGAAGSFTVPANAQSGVIAIAAGLEHSLVLKSDGTVVAWGTNSFGEATVPANLTGVTRIGAGEYFSLVATGGTAPSLGTVGGGGGGGTATLAVAPFNLVGYRGKTGQVYQFTVTGSTAGIVWGSDVYTDDSNVARAAVHAGVLAVGETKTVTVTILPGQASYAATTRNGIASASWGAWSGSYSFAGAGAVAGVPAATARPAAAPGFVAGTAALAAGGRLVCPVTVTGGGTYTYQWYLNGILIAGATANPYIVESLTAANAGTYAADVSNSLSGGTPTRITAGTITVGAAGSPVIALQPISKTVVPGATVSFATSASGSGL
ncbi:MAG: hypothetical protein RLZZ15_1977, partial [Verrucomicrobiota bacterium]